MIAYGMQRGVITITNVVTARATTATAALAAVAFHGRDSLMDPNQAVCNSEFSFS